EARETEGEMDKAKETASGKARPKPVFKAPRALSNSDSEESASGDEEDELGESDKDE
ncbi:hypothetical protein FRC09_000570, partial [Ceratobasidium sp. 395]